MLLEPGGRMVQNVEVGDHGRPGAATVIGDALVSTSGCGRSPITRKETQ